MPSKYSHSLVLATYSSRGIIAVPQDQQPNPTKSGNSVSQHHAPQHGRIPSQHSLATFRARPKSGLSTVEVPQAPSSHPQKAAPQQRSQHGPRRPTAARNNTVPLDGKVSHKVTGDSAGTLVGHGTRGQEAQPRLSTSSTCDRALGANSSPLSSGAARASQESEARLVPATTKPAQVLSQRAGDSAPSRQSRLAKSVGLEPRDDVKTTVRFHPSRELHNQPSPLALTVDDEILLSLQQFLKSAPRPPPPTHRRSITPQPASGRSRLLSPAFAPSTQVPLERRTRSAQSFHHETSSFIDSSEDEAAVDDTPATTWRSQSSTSGGVKPRHGSGTPNGIDGRLSTSPIRILSQQSPITPGSPDRASIGSRRDSSDSDGIQYLPLQKPSPLRKPPPKASKMVAFHGQPVFEAPEELSSSTFDKLLPALPIEATIPQASLGLVGLEPGTLPDVSAFGGEHVETPTDDLYGHQRYYRAIHQDLDQELEGRRSPPPTQTSLRWRRLAGSGDSDVDQTGRSGSPESAETHDSTPSPERVRRVQRSAVSRSVNPMPNFGVPSIVRNPEQKARLNAQALTHATVRQRPSHSLDRYRPQRAATPDARRHGPISDLDFSNPPRRAELSVVFEEMGPEHHLSALSDASNLSDPTPATVETSMPSVKGLSEDGSEGGALHGGAQSDLEDEGDEDGDGHKHERTALPPPNISLYRRSEGDEGHDTTIFDILRAGPQDRRSLPRDFGPSQAAMIRLEAIAREQDAVNAASRFGRAKTAFGRLMKMGS